MLVEQRPRMQSKGPVMTPDQGYAIVIAVIHRPKRGGRGNYRLAMN